MVAQAITPTTLAIPYTYGPRVAALTTGHAKARHDRRAGTRQAHGVAKLNQLEAAINARIFVANYFLDDTMAEAQHRAYSPKPTPGWDFELISRRTVRVHAIDRADGTLSGQHLRVKDENLGVDYHLSVVVDLVGHQAVLFGWADRDMVLSYPRYRSGPFAGHEVPLQDLYGEAMWEAELDAIRAIY